MTTPKRFGDWARATCEDDGTRHLFPLDDLNPHHYEDCACRPELVDGLHVHNSFDGREAFEQGVRKPS